MISLQPRIVQLVMILAGLLHLSAAHAAERPNILWIVSEDNSASWFRLYDPQGAPAPNLEKLAAHGLVFNHAFANAPVCSSSRSTIISGAYGPRMATQFHRRAYPVPMPEGLRMFPAYLRQAGYYTTNNSKTDYNQIMDKEAWDASSGKATWRDRKPGQPFFHVQNFTTTHEGSLHFPAKDVSAKPTTTSPDALKLAPYHPDTPLMRYTYARYLDNHRKLDTQIGELLAKLEADGLAQDTIIFYYGDHGGVLPRSKGFLYESGLRVPLVVSFPEKWKHLAPVAPGSRVDGFVSFVDLAPTVLRLAGVEPPAAMDGRAFLGESVSAAELNARDEVYSFADRFDEKNDLVRALRKGKYKYIRSFQPFNPDGLHNNYRYLMAACREWRELFYAGKLTPEQSQFFQPRAAEALYDLESDPHELKNLAADPAHAATLADLRGRLISWMKSQHDLGLIPENVLMREARANPVAYGAKHAKLLAGLIDVANLQLLPFAQAEKELGALLEAKNPWVRYWALNVCSAFGPAAASLADKAAALAKSDPERLVRVRAAEFLSLAVKADPRPVIYDALKSSSDPVEVNQILGTVVLLRDGPAKVDFEISADWFPAEWRAKGSKAPREYVSRLVYLGKLPPGADDGE